MKTVTELIENYSGPDTSQDVLKEFAVELLELVYPSGATNATKVLKNVEKVLAEMRKKDVKA